MEAEALVATFVATLVGGMLSLFGSVYVARRESRRAAWIRLFDEFLPQFQPQLPVVIHHGPEKELSIYLYATSNDLLQAMRRTAKLAGKKTQQLVSEVESTVRRLNRDVDPAEERRVFGRAAEGHDEPPSEPVSQADAIARLAELRRVDFDRACRARARLEQFLCRKLRIQGE